MKQTKDIKKALEEIGLDINQPMDVSSNGDFEHGLKLTVAIQGKKDLFWNNDLRLAAIKHLISTLDFKQMVEEDWNISEKYYLTILDEIGMSLSWNYPFHDGEKRNIEKVGTFIKHSLASGRLEQYEEEGLIDQKEDDDDFEL
ncbi:hypothetical protein D5F52_26345 (plasmid) [Brevibacillus laterosporus]|uniref:hypothetical protein n=1 Tax=Brevibacillus laterosporus TaxID=1465 RepID=UPI000E6BE07A|nr:hypothetical protein [Brevibacillus laterosporus]AYB41677.1 hypothetical protein D5F52_26345 [Brevibacillus laterosporus]